MNVQLPDMSELLPALLTPVPFALLMVCAAVLLNVIARRGLAALVRRTRLTEEEVVPIRRIVKWIITASAAVLILGAFGLNVTGLWGVLSTILAMVAIGFVAVWSVLSNTLCALLIIVVRPFSVGDEVEFAGDPVKGRVLDLNFIYTTLDAGDGSLLQVPNNLFFQKVLRRRVGTKTRALHMGEKQPEVAAETATVVR
jgi:small-conductance mechanosensitive channel